MYNQFMMHGQENNKNVLLFKFRCNIFIGVRIIKEMQGSVASGTPCIIHGTDDKINERNWVTVENVMLATTSLRIYVLENQNI